LELDLEKKETELAQKEKELKEAYSQSDGRDQQWDGEFKEMEARYEELKDVRLADLLFFPRHWGYSTTSPTEDADVGRTTTSLWVGLKQNLQARDAEASGLRDSLADAEGLLGGMRSKLEKNQEELAAYEEERKALEDEERKNVEEIQLVSLRSSSNPFRGPSANEPPCTGCVARQSGSGTGERARLEDRRRG
jgi:hypothetical protein